MKTMLEIAREAGLSRYTVSKILRGDASVRPGNREKVLKLCERNGFVPNANAVSLASKSSNVLAMAVPYITDGFYAELIELTEHCAARHGYRLAYQSTYNDAARETQVLRSFLSMKAAALLVVPVVPQPDRKTHALAAANLPLIYLDRAIADGTSAVLNDNEESAYAMTAHLASLRREIAFFDSFYGEANPTAVARRHGYAKAMHDAGLQPLFIPIADHAETQDNERFGYANFAAYLGTRRPPQALFCVTDAVALGAMRALRDAGFTPGQDTLVGGHDGLRFTGYTFPALSTMVQPKREMAECAVELALARIADPSLPAERRVFSSALLIRASTSRNDAETIPDSMQTVSTTP